MLVKKPVSTIADPESPRYILPRDWFMIIQSNDNDRGLYALKGGCIDGRRRDQSLTGLS